MQRAFVVKIGAPEEAVEVRSVDEVAAGPGQVVVAVAAAPVNPADLLLLTGRHLAKPALPSTVGIEGAGVVHALGPGVDALAVGQPVALPFGGTWSERVVMEAADVIALPAGIDLVQASMLSVNPATAAGLLEGVGAGQWVLQNAAASAVGKLVVRLAARRGIRTVNVVRREAQRAELEAIGASAVLVGDEDLAARVKEVTGGAPVTRALDAVAGEATGKLFSAVADGGTLVCYGLLSDDRVILPANELIFRDVKVQGYSRLRSMRGMDPARIRALYAELAEMLQAGEITTQVEAEYPLASVKEAVAHAGREGRTGKIVIRCSA